nr:hypothetical protein [Tanacetum cinerariifolium]
MMVQPQKDMDEDSEIPTDSHHTPIVTQPSTSSQPQQKHKSKKSKKRITEVPQLSDTHDVADEHVTTTSNDLLLSGVALVDETQGRNYQDMFDTNILDDEEVVAEKEVSIADPVPTAGEVVTTTAELEEEERLVRQKEEEANISLIESWDNTQAIMDADYEIATRLQEEERGELTIEEKSSKKAAEGSSKRATNKIEQEDAKRQRIEEENESVELKRCLEIIPDNDDDVKIEATPLSSKSPTIVDYKIYKEGRKSFFKIIRADGNS